MGWGVLRAATHPPPRRLIEPDFGKRRLASITPAEVAAWHAKIGESRGKRLAAEAEQTLLKLA